MNINAKDITISKGKIKVKTNKRGMIVFAMSWCPYCQNNEPVYREVAQLMSNELNLFYINGDKNKENAELFEKLSKKKLINGYPTILFINDSGIAFAPYKGERNVREYLQGICKNLQSCRR